MHGASEPAWSPMDALGFGWNVVTKRFSTVALHLALGLFVTFFFLYVFIFGGSFTAAFLTERGVVDRDVGDVVRLASFGAGSIVWLIVLSFMLGGLASTALKAARGQPTSFGDPFSGGRYFVPSLVASIVGSIAYTIGAALCIVPAFIVGTGLVLYPVLIVDQGLSGVDALKRSWEMTKGHRLNIFLFWLISIFVILAGELACFFGVFLISYPLLLVAGAWIYLRIKGEGVPQPT
jgi:uncharacterized membrane protein